MQGASHAKPSGRTCLIDRVEFRTDSIQLCRPTDSALGKEENLLAETALNTHPGDIQRESVHSHNERVISGRGVEFVPVEGNRLGMPSTR